jgi:predicted DNA binding CopG/RHH family protein
VLSEPVDSEISDAEAAAVEALVAITEADIEERLRDDRDGKERTSLRWGSDQLNVVREAARLAGVPYETYIKVVVYRQALADVQAAQQIGQRGSTAAS